MDDGSQAICPTPDMAGDDGLLTLEEGLPAYGPVVLGLEPFPIADADGNVSFEQTFTLDDASLDLSAHVVVLHGMTVEDEYVGSLPVACGLIMPEGSFVSELSGANELPEPVESEGSGFANYVITPDGDIVFTLVVNGLTDVTAAHIHLENEGEDTGGVVAPLFSADTEEGVASNGILASGVITADDLSGALEGMALEDLMAAMEAGETYTNVHTVTNPPGELRGQIEAQGSAVAGDHTH
ncbi:MAG: CHRD domain-containing protein [Chloroflexia bacterium]|nr:CHRD domain-containing protein [Chloroflexia bacterium]